jgi:DNA-binding LacI/PurR family transcriptional regulator
MKKGLTVKPSKKQHKRPAVTQKDIAKLAGVSTALVSYVINDGPLPVAEDTRQRVLQTIQALGYRPNKHAQRLRSKTDQVQRQLGIIMGGGSDMLQHPYYPDILAGIYDEAHRLGQHIRFLHFFDELQDPMLFNEHVHPEEISALILFAPDLSSANPQNQVLLNQILERITNVVCLEQTIANVPAVIFDRNSAARTAVTHLIKLGHQQVGFVGSPDERLAGYRQTLLDHGLSYDNGLVKETHNSPEEGYERVLQLLDLNPRPTAIFAANDETAIGILGALHDRGLKAPDDLALVSIDDINLAVVVRPTLTTVRVPRRQMGMYALHMLAMHRDHPDIQPASMVLPTELIIRQSCGAKKE